MRVDVTTAPAKIVSGVSRGTGRGEEYTRSFLILDSASSHTVLFETGDDTTTAPDMAAAARVDFSKLAALTYSCEPGRALWASVASGTVTLDVLPGGEQ